MKTKLTIRLRSGCCVRLNKWASQRLMKLRRLNKIVWIKEVWV
jgi:hypothetical protein